MGDKRNTKKKPVKPADVEETREEMREAIPALLNEYLPDSVTEVRERAIADGLKPDPETESLADGVKRLSPSRLVLNRFFRSKLSVIGLAIIVFLFAFSFLGPLFTAWGETEVDEVNENGRLSYVERIIEFTGPDGETYEVVAVSETIYLFDTTAPPSLSHIFGTDEEAMDVLTRTMYGGQKSLLLGFLVVFLSTFVGVVFGGLAGYFGKWVDNVIMRVVDVFNCLPTLPILLIASALLDALGVDPKDRIYWLMLILTVFNWAGTARMVRGQILSLREQEYMLAAEALGASAFSKIFKHLIPNVMPLLIVGMTLSLGGVILYESTLSYLGLGVPPPHAAWGSIISASRAPDVLAKYPFIWMPPGICIVLAVLAFNFIGDGLRDAFDPKARR